MGDDEIRQNVEDLPVPNYATTAFALPPSLASATVAVVSTAGLRDDGVTSWDLGDPRFTVLSGDATRAIATHISPAFDRTGFLADPNVIMPIDRLRELAERGEIGRVAPRHLSFMGAQPDEGLAAIRLDYGPAAARLLKADGVDVVLLTGVCPYCTRTICVLAHAFEEAGLSTIVLASVRGQAARMHPPRALYCHFPFGRPLGQANDPAFQHRVLSAAFATLRAPSGPVLVEFEERIVDELDSPMMCSLPARFDATLHPAADEAKGLLPAYNRGRVRRGKTHVGRALAADAVPDALSRLARVGKGELPEAVGLDVGQIAHIGADVRWYYEEAAFELAEAPLSARATEAWIYGKTEAGQVLLSAQAALRAAGLSRDVWFYLAPPDRARAFVRAKP